MAAENTAASNAATESEKHHLIVHDHSATIKDDMDISGEMFLQKKDIDGYSVSFHVMPVGNAMNHGGTHNVMIKVEQNGVPLDNILINTKMINPNDLSQTRRPMKMGDWYMAGYDLGKVGKHQLLVLFKTADNNTHWGGVFYPGKAEKHNH
jgi:hypothetical protein